MIHTTRQFVCGMTESGKSGFVRSEILPHFPRVIVADPIGDYSKDMGIPVVFGVRATLEAVRESVYRGKTSWGIVASIGREEIAELTEALIPSRDAYSSFVLAIGGVCLVLEEVDILTPAGQGGPAVSSLFRRGRHVGLSVVSVSQRPGNASKECIAQASRVISYRLFDPADKRYLIERCGKSFLAQAEKVWTKDYHALEWDRGVVSEILPDYSRRKIGPTAEQNPRTTVVEQVKDRSGEKGKEAERTGPGTP